MDPQYLVQIWHRLVVPGPSLSHLKLVRPELANFVKRAGLGCTYYFLLGLPIICLGWISHWTTKYYLFGWIKFRLFYYLIKFQVNYKRAQILEWGLMRILKFKVQIQPMYTPTHRVGHLNRWSPLKQKKLLKIMMAGLSERPTCLFFNNQLICVFLFLMEVFINKINK